LGATRSSFARVRFVTHWFVNPIPRGTPALLEPGPRAFPVVPALREIELGKTALGKVGGGSQLGRRGSKSALPCTAEPRPRPSAELFEERRVRAQTLPLRTHEGAAGAGPWQKQRRRGTASAWRQVWEGNLSCSRGAQEACIGSGFGARPCCAIRRAAAAGVFATSASAHWPLVSGAVVEVGQVHMGKEPGPAVASSRW